MNDWESAQARKQAVANIFYALMFGLFAGLVIVGLAWLLGKAGGRW